MSLITNHAAPAEEGAAYLHILDEDAVAEHVVIELRVKRQPNLQPHGIRSDMAVASSMCSSSRRHLQVEVMTLGLCTQCTKGPTFSVRRPPGAVSFVVTHNDRVSLVYLTCRSTGSRTSTLILIPSLALRS